MQQECNPCSSLVVFCSWPIYCWQFVVKYNKTMLLNSVKNLLSVIVRLVSPTVQHQIRLLMVTHCSFTIHAQMTFSSKSKLIMIRNSPQRKFYNPPPSINCKPQWMQNSQNCDEILFDSSPNGDFNGIKRRVSWIQNDSTRWFMGWNAKTMRNANRSRQKCIRKTTIQMK